MVHHFTTSYKAFEKIYDKHVIDPNGTAYMPPEKVFKAGYLACAEYLLNDTERLNRLTKIVN